MHRRKPPPPPSPSPTSPSGSTPLLQPCNAYLHNKPSPSLLEHPLAAFLLLCTLRLISALTMPIADCDETFNYWEPMHYLLFGHGLQTWEYSPAFALRSYAYLLPYKLVASAAVHTATLLSRLAPSLIHLSPKISAFYAVRLTQGTLCAAAETYLYHATYQKFGTDVARLLLLFLVSSPGIFRASVEFLPSSFAMISLTAAFAAWMNRRFPAAIFFVALASLFGWVFAAAMSLPMAIDILLSERGVLIFAKYSVASGITILTVMAGIDSFFYGILVVTPFQHLVYNVFPKDGAGSHIFGVESALFYVINLFLNCNIAAVLLASFPLLCVTRAVQATLCPQSQNSIFGRLRFLIPTYIWLAILGYQPHKEERFLVPSYTFIALIAAVAFADWLELLIQIMFKGGGESTKTASNKRTDEADDKNTTKMRRVWTAPCITRWALSSILTLSTLALGYSRIMMQIIAFQAPLQIYHHLSRYELKDGAGPRQAPNLFSSPRQEVNICMGKEWYRFPTSFFLPDRRFKIRFIRDGFTGLMPKPFSEDEDGTRTIPSGMNEFNREDPSQFYDWRAEVGCHYFIDLDLSHRQSALSQAGSQHEDVSPIPQESRKTILTHRFLDSELSSAGYRAFYLPAFNNKIVYGEYKLIRNIDLLPNIL